MGDRITPAPDTSDARLAELIRWTSKSGMSDVHALLLDLQCRRAAQTASAERVRAVVREAIDHSRHLPHGQAERAIADRVAAQLTAPSIASAADRAEIELCPVPYGLGPDDLDLLERMRRRLNAYADEAAVLTKIIAAHRAPGARS